ncbi:MAG: hypothetical protein HYS05_10375, partial [Acidobacteria bacterium]|nr:hypothetical protein [Acidobacteriota bacterium]
EDILASRVKGQLYDAYRQSWVASPEPAYVAAGNAPLQAPLAGLQAMLDAPQQTVDVKGKPVPAVGSGVVEAERRLLQACGVLNSEGRITPWLITKDACDAPEKLLTSELWDSIYGVPAGEITIEHIQHAFYMAANYGFQILNGNFAAAIDDYELSLRFMNDLATYRIDVSWLWSLLRHEAAITRDGYLKGPALTEDGVVPASNRVEVKAGTRFTRDLFEQLWDCHNQWTAAFFAELDRRGDRGRFDRAKAPIIMEILKRQLLSPRYIQHSARVLFLVAQASAPDRAQILDAIFDLSREDVVERVHAGSFAKIALSAHDYVPRLVAPFRQQLDRRLPDRAAQLAALAQASKSTGAHVREQRQRGARRGLGVRHEGQLQLVAERPLGVGAQHPGNVFRNQRVDARELRDVNDLRQRDERVLAKVQQQQRAWLLEEHRPSALTRPRRIDHALREGHAPDARELVEPARRVGLELFDRRRRHVPERAFELGEQLRFAAGAGDHELESCLAGENLARRCLETPHLNRHKPCALGQLEEELPPKRQRQVVRLDLQAARLDEIVGVRGFFDVAVQVHDDPPLAAIAFDSHNRPRVRSGANCFGLVPRTGSVYYGR